jgi:hypothetical protein
MDCLDAHFYEIDRINILVVTFEFLVKYLLLINLLKPAPVY